jgi:hypothetical protein
MPKVKISEFDIDPANNTDINSINIAEGCAPSGINNAIRQLMSDLKEFQTGGAGDPFNGAVNGTVGATTANTGAFTTLSASGVTTVSAGTVSAPAITTTGDTNTGIFFPAADTIAFTEGGVESMRINSSGNLGVGTTNPTQKLQITGSSVSLKLEDTSGAAYNVTSLTASGAASTISWDADNVVSGSYLSFVGDGSEKMRIDSSGNVGIGTSSPSSKLHVVASGTAGSATTVAQLYAGSTAGLLVDVTPQTSGSSAVNLYANTGGDFVTSSILAFDTRNSGTRAERMRIDSSGNLLVGTTTTDPTFNRVNGIQITPSGSIYARANNPWDLGRNVTSGLHISFYTDNGSARVGAGNISSNGSTTTYATSSDYRMKTDVQPMTNALNKVMQLNPVTYKWVNGLGGTKENGEGFIAHELQAVVPDCVTGEKDEVDAEGKPVYQGIDTSFLVATLTASIQELKAIVDAQAERIAVLESK